MIEQGLHALLASDPTVSGLVGARIFPVLVPEGQMPTKAGDPPTLSYQVVTASSTVTLLRQEFDDKRIQFDAWGMLYSDCKAVKQAVKNLLDTYVGTLTDGTRVICAMSATEIDFYEEDARLYRCMFEYRVRFVEP